MAAQIKLQKEIEPIVKILATSQGLSIGLLGSRASGKAKRYSDWDLGIYRGQPKIETTEYLRLKTLVEDLAEDLPREVDLINLNEAPNWFLKSLDYDPAYLAGSKKSWKAFLKKLHDTKTRKP